ncbi:MULTISPECIES: DUF3667 domain-containing protein [unclassified Ekhidna]|uniref:DUF3667 domain-containing protein n=1 Tax=unclassified Ekhidna TaxID=2632188 RepID=UPI0032DEFCAD
MKKRRKHKACLNCGELLQQKHNYCPNCGQENTDNQVSIGLLLREFLSNFFSLDSRFGRTFKPFLFSPGKLTVAFNEGRRVLYANPIRWYLVISIFHFFFMAKMFEPTVKDRQLRGFQDEMEELSQQKFDSLYALPDTTKNGWPIPSTKSELVDHLIVTTTLTPPEILDSLNLKFDSWHRQYSAEKVIKISQETTASLNNYIMRQIPIIIFFILPIYALLLKVFFWRKGLYIKHLIHSIHIHALFFFLLGWVWIFSLMIEDFEDFGIGFSLLLTCLYIVISFRRVYGIKYIWGAFRLLIIGFIYSIVLTFSLVIGVILSLALL